MRRDRFDSMQSLLQLRVANFVHLRMFGFCVTHDDHFLIRKALIYNDKSDQNTHCTAVLSFFSDIMCLVIYYSYFAIFSNWCLSKSNQAYTIDNFWKADDSTNDICLTSLSDVLKTFVWYYWSKYWCSKCQDFQELPMMCGRLSSKKNVMEP